MGVRLLRIWHQDHIQKGLREHDGWSPSEIGKFGVRRVERGQDRWQICQWALNGDSKRRVMVFLLSLTI